jgi:hypothetical protein
MNATDVIATPNGGYGLQELWVMPLTAHSPRFLFPRRRIADSARDVDDLVAAVGGLIV